LAWAPAVVDAPLFLPHGERPEIKGSAWSRRLLKPCSNRIKLMPYACLAEASVRHQAKLNRRSSVGWTVPDPLAVIIKSFRRASRRGSAARPRSDPAFGRIALHQRSGRPRSSAECSSSALELPYIPKRRPEHGKCGRTRTRLPLADARQPCARFLPLGLEAAPAISSASAAPSRPCRASARTNPAAARTKIWCAAAPERIFPMTSSGADSPATWRRAGAGFRRRILHSTLAAFPSGMVRSTLSRSIADSIYLWLRPCGRGLWVMAPDRGDVFAKAAPIEKARETDMRLKLLSPGEMKRTRKKKT